MSISVNLNNATGTGTTYETSPTAVYLFSNAAVSTSGMDQDNTIDSLTVALGAHTTAMSLSLDSTAAGLASTNGISVSYNPSTGTLTLTGSNEQTSVWQSILRGLLFDDTSGSPTDPGAVTVTAKNTSTGNTGVDTQALHLDPAPVNLFMDNNADQFSSQAYNLSTGPR